MKTLTKLAVLAVTAGLLSGCASGPSHKTTDYLLCATAGAIVGGAIGAAADDSSGAEVGVPAGAAVAALLCPTRHEPAAPVCAEEPPTGATLDANGCAFDSDNDGVFDGIDQCPDTPNGVEVNAYGCPLDTDQDGVLDYKDECPATALGTEVNEVGCPMPGEKILSLTGVNFEFNSAALTPEAEGRLDKAAKMIKDAASSVEIRVEGHTDNVGDAQYNKELSEKRAKVVAAYLVVTHGVDDEKLIAVGMGESQPVASNETAEGRAQNRRVDFIVSQ
mgnify:CR=1 FL=1